MWGKLLAGGCGCLFGVIALAMALVPAEMLASNGIDFNSLPVAGRAELRAYYVGTALFVAWICATLDVAHSLRAVAILLGTFVATRALGYWVDGVDPDPTLRTQQHGTCCAELIGCIAALALGGVCGRPKQKQR